MNLALINKFPLILNKETDRVKFRHRYEKLGFTLLPVGGAPVTNGCPVTKPENIS